MPASRENKTFWFYTPLVSPSHSRPASGMQENSLLRKTKIDYLFRWNKQRKWSLYVQLTVNGDPHLCKDSSIRPSVNGTLGFLCKQTFLFQGGLPGR